MDGGGWGGRRIGIGKRGRYRISTGGGGLDGNGGVVDAGGGWRGAVYESVRTGGGDFGEGSRRGEAFGLQVAEQAEGSVGGAAEAVLKVRQALDGSLGFELEELGFHPMLVGVGGELLGRGSFRIDVAFGAVDGGDEEGAFEVFEAAEFPEFHDEAMDEFGFDGAGGVKVGEVVVEDGVVAGGVLEVGDGDAAVEAVLEVVGADGGAATGGAGAGGALGVAAVGGALTVG